MKEKCTNCETRDHIKVVQKNIGDVLINLSDRALDHDQSKLEEPEAEGFRTVGKALKGMTYGSQEYKDQLVAMKPFLDHHYASNSHHPEHWADGINGMSLLDMTEMICDWQAASQRHDDGCIVKSVEINAKRFNMEQAHVRLLSNTVVELYPEDVRRHNECVCGCYRERAE